MGSDISRISFLAKTNDDYSSSLSGARTICTITADEVACSTSGGSADRVYCVTDWE